MKIKKLIVRKTKPSEEIIREIPFNEKGLSLIIDNTPKDIRESGNSVGKSTAIKINEKVNGFGKQVQMGNRRYIRER